MTTIAAVATAAALLAAFCWMLRARRLRAERDRISAELDQAHYTGAGLAVRLDSARRFGRMQAREINWLRALRDEACRECPRLRAELAAVDKSHAAFVSALAEEFEVQGEQALELARRVTELEGERDSAAARTAEGIAAWLDAHATDRAKTFAEAVRSGTWRADMEALHG